MSKLSELLQPKGYVSKIKLYCLDCTVEGLVTKVGKLEKNLPRIIEIKLVNK